MKTETVESFPGVSDVLKRAREHLQRGWCQGDLALESRGGRVNAMAPEAVQFCAIGAIARAAGELVADHEWVMESEAVVRLAGMLNGSELVGRWGSPGSAVVRWNNDPNRTQEEVLEAFDRAAEGK